MMKIYGAKRSAQVEIKSSFRVLIAKCADITFIENYGLWAGGFVGHQIPCERMWLGSFLL